MRERLIVGFDLEGRVAVEALDELAVLLVQLFVLMDEFLILGQQFFVALTFGFDQLREGIGQLFLDMIDPLGKIADPALNAALEIGKLGFK